MIFARIQLKSIAGVTMVNISRTEGMMRDKPQYDSLTENIISAFKRCNELDELCGEMLATLCVNRNRGTLATADDAEFDAMVTMWRKRWQSA